MNDGIKAYNDSQTPENRAICEELASLIAAGLIEASSVVEGLMGAEGKVWHGGPVWFLAGNPVAGYWVRKMGVQLLFWSGQDFDEAGLSAEGKFRAAAVVYAEAGQIIAGDVQRWLAKAAVIQWDYKNIVKRNGKLEKLGVW